MASVSQRQVQKMLQKLSPQQIQMIKLLELPALQLEQRIKQEIEENPVLEEDTSEEKEEEQPPKEVSVEEYFAEDDTPRYKYQINNFSKDDDRRPVYISEGHRFGKTSSQQLGYKHLSPRQQKLAEYLVGSLDDDGYLRRDLLSIADDLAFTQGIEVSEAELEETLHLIQQLEPAGVGARTLQECLLLQLDAQPEPSRIQQLAKKLLTNYFDEFTKKHYDKLMSRLGISAEEFREVVDEILRLSPKPGNLYTEGRNEMQPYVVPDFILDYQNGIFDLSLNSANVPDIKINRHYMEMIREMVNDQGKQTSEKGKEALQFVKNKIDSAKWFISAIKQRHDTLLRTMQAILNYQRDYFVEGDPSKLRPMILKDIADATSLDVSTISRVVNSKYVQTHFGIIPLKQLFSEAMQTDSGEEVSSYEIKQLLQECIDKEDKHKPLTDEVLMDMLNSKGYHIARRTVAKYREMLGIPVARLRKEI